jgi:hypothetical protein
LFLPPHLHAIRSKGVEQQKSRHPEQSEGPLYPIFVFAYSCLHTFMQSALVSSS